MKQKIVIEVEGDNAEDIVKEFWSWFLDGGGEQSFFDSVEAHHEFSAMTKHSGNGWYIEQLSKEEEDAIIE